MKALRTYRPYVRGYAHIGTLTQHMRLTHFVVVDIKIVIAAVVSVGILKV